MTSEERPKKFHTDDALYPNLVRGEVHQGGGRRNGPKNQRGGRNRGENVGRREKMKGLFFIIQK